MNIPQKDIKAFQKKILSWYEKHKRDLPWRGTRDPYRILVSEIMLQQTQVSRVIPKYEAWLDAFPTIEVLAKAKTSEVLRLWSGLGYNRRALYLQKAAKALEELRINNYELRKKTNKNTFWPETIEALKKLPGIGEYTAAAVACFAFNEQIAVVDTNVRKVILTQFSITNFQFSSKELQDIADSLLPKGGAYEWNQALMDYASAMLKQEKIPLVKQSTFKNSNRYYRGQIIKVLLDEQSIRQLTLLQLFGIEKQRLEKIVQGMEKDGLIKQDEQNITIKNEE